MVRVDRVAIIVTARSGSARMHQKHLETIGATDVMSRMHILCRQADVGPTIWAVPTGDPYADILMRRGELYVTGSEHDVLGRFVAAARASAAHHYVRVTGDCPLMWPDLVRWVVRDHLERGNDFTSVCREPSRVPDGLDVEVMSWRFLKELDKRMTGDDDRYREHVTLRAYEMWDELSETYRMEGIRYPLPMGEKWSLDTEDDLERIRAHVAGQG